MLITYTHDLANCMQDPLPVLHQLCWLICWDWRNCPVRLVSWCSSKASVKLRDLRLQVSMIVQSESARKKWAPLFCTWLHQILADNSFTVTIDYRQAATSAQCCRPCGQWHTEVRSRSDVTPAQWAGVKVRRNAAERSSGTSHFELSEFRHL